MLYKEFGPPCYEKQAPVYKTYQTENGKETLLVSKNYNILKQSKFTDLKIYKHLKLEHVVFQTWSKIE